MQYSENDSAFNFWPKMADNRLTRLFFIYKKYKINNALKRYLGSFATALGTQRVIEKNIVSLLLFFFEYGLMSTLIFSD